ncbi:MAG: phosphate ABC transporter permease subunit PstC [Hyphomicrobiaceae bacterium]|nr:MAG: phosphate ABC transporter permease subunit PstC [Hyphomicrobiaceae bacterium]
MAGFYWLTLAVLVVTGFLAGRYRAVAFAGSRGSGQLLHSLPAYHGLFTAAVVLVPMLLVFAIGAPLVTWLANSAALAKFSPDVAADELKRATALRDILNLIAGQYSGTPPPDLVSAAASYSLTLSRGNWITYLLGAGSGVLGIMLSLWRISGRFRARNHFERFVIVVLGLCAAVAILTTIGIVFSVLFETYRFFFDPALKGKPTIPQFLFGTEWNPQAALRADQGDIKTAFGFVPLLTGTLLITAIALFVAGPLGLFSAIYLAEYATPRIRAIAKPILEILAGIPTVVLGFFAALTVAPLIRGWGERFGLDIASESALAAGLVMGMMIIPFISSLSDDVINAVPQSLRDGSYAMGATRSETIKRVVLPAALPGIVSAFMLAISRAIGETMIVVMAAGLAANLTFNPLETVTTITVQIKTILVGDQEFDSAKTLAAFALGFVLFFLTLVLNVIALQVVRRYREQYD